VPEKNSELGRDLHAGRRRKVSRSGRLPMPQLLPNTAQSLICRRPAIPGTTHRSITRV